MLGSGGVPYRPDIDGLRALAVLPVVLFHLGVPWLPGGFLGVDVFFVISGYLITGLLLREFQKGGGGFLLAFWRRRILRILPALLAVVLATVVVGQFLLYAPDRYLLAVNAAGALTSIGNITHWLHYGGYWSADAKDSPLLHMWSLGVEEQFYLAYPLFLLVAWRTLRARSWIPIVLGIVASAGLYLYVAHARPAAAFYLFPTRGWELLAGAAVATLNMQRVPAPRLGTLLAYGGLASIFVGYLLTPEADQAIGSMIVVAGATAVVAAGSPGTSGRIGLTNRALVWIGLISYSLYLWHWPVIVFARGASERYGVETPSWLLLAISIGLGWLSWRFIEKPFRASRGNRVPIALLATAIVGAVGLYAIRGLNDSEDLSTFRPARWAGELYNVNPAGDWPAHIVRRMQGIEVSPRPLDRQTLFREQGVLSAHGGNGLDVLVLGDSHGLMWAPAIDAAAAELDLTTIFMTADGTTPFFDPENPVATRDDKIFQRAQRTDFNIARARLISEHKPRVVVIATRWGEKSLDQARPLLEAIVGAGSKVLLIEDPPEFDIGDRNAPQYMAYLGLQPTPSGHAWSSRVRTRHTQEKLRAIRSVSWLCPDACRIVETSDLYLHPRDTNALLVAHQQVPTYIDDDHLSLAGALLAVERLKRELALSTASSSPGPAAP